MARSSNDSHLSILTSRRNLTRRFMQTVKPETSWHHCRFRRTELRPDIPSDIETMDPNITYIRVLAVLDSCRSTEFLWRFPNLETLDLPYTGDYLAELPIKLAHLQSLITIGTGGISHTLDCEALSAFRKPSRLSIRGRSSFQTADGLEGGTALRELEFVGCGQLMHTQAFLALFATAANLTVLFVTGSRKLRLPDELRPPASFTKLTLDSCKASLQRQLFLLCRNLHCFSARNATITDTDDVFWGSCRITHPCSG
ncbi:hypothetical protein DFJ77DRAFT_35751 [Powellomyces hirtus]|nr:hypothetical protein DFJ77DRAFT_35751 [Powellomyces hirtus]